MTKAQKFFITILFILGIMSLILMFTYNPRGKINLDEYTIETYKVKSGDSLWKIASSNENCADKDSKQDWIAAVMELNNCSANLQIGQTLKIYVYDN